MTKALALIALISMPSMPVPVAPCGTLQTIQGASYYCCSLKSGQQCCSNVLDGGKPRGCNC